MANKVEVEVALSAKKAQKAVNDLGKSLEKFTKSFGGQFNKAEKEYKEFGETVEKSNKKVQNSLKKSDIALASFVGNVTGGIALRAFEVLKNAPLEAFDAFRRFEKGLVSVAKTTNLSGKDLDDLAQNIEQLSTQLPTSSEELLQLATVAGQLGVRGTDNLTNFAETIAKLGRVSNISGEEAGLALTRILNVTDTGIDKIDEFSSVIVALGNNFATTESEIVSITSEVARASAQFGVTAEDSASLGTVLRSVGVRAEEAGGVISKSFIAIQSAINKGGKSLEQLSKLTGIASENLREAFAQNALGVFQNLLNGIAKAGPQASTELEKIGLSGIRVSKVLPTLARNTDELTRALALGRKEMVNATAQNEEFAKSLDSVDAELKLAQNSMALFYKNVGEFFSPAVEAGASVVKDFFNVLNGVAPSAKEVDDRIESLTNKIERLRAQGFDDSSPIIQKELALLDRLTSAKEAENRKREEEIRLRKEIEKLQAEELRKFSGGAGLSKEGAKTQTTPFSTDTKTPADDARVKSRQQALAELAQLEQENELAEQERALRLKEVQGVATEEDLQALRDIEQEKLNIRAEAELEKNALIKDAKLREIQDEKVANKLMLDTQRLQARQEIEIEKKKAMQKKAVQQAQLSTARNFLSAGITLAKEGSAVQKGLMIADATIATWTAVNKALASPPGPPWSIALASSIGAMGLANVAKIAGVGFRDGGVVGGFTGSSVGPDNQVAQVRTGEMILNSSQQRNLFNQISSGDFNGENSSIDKLSNSIEMITSQPIVVEIDGKEIARATRNAERDGFQVSA